MLNNTQIYLKSQEEMGDFNKILILLLRILIHLPPFAILLNQRRGGLLKVAMCLPCYLQDHLSVSAEIISAALMPGNYGVGLGKIIAVGVSVGNGSGVGVVVVEPDGLPHSERQVASLSSTFFISTGSSG